MIENKSVVRFPRWVKPPTPCETRTFSIVLTDSDPAGAIRMEMRFTNAPTELRTAPNGTIYYAFKGEPLPGEMQKMLSLQRRSLR